MSEVFNADVLDAINRALSAENVVAHEGEEPVYCNVNNETREIEIPGEITIFGVEHDENAVRVFFKCPKIIGDNVDIDITRSMVYIIYINAGGEKDQYIVTDVNETEDGDVTFSWLINRKPAKYQGITQFGIRVIKSKTGGEIENEWNTTVANANILNGVETEDIELSGDNIDVVNQLLDLTKQEIELTKQNSIEEIEQKGQETLETIPDDYTTAAQNALSAKNEVEDIRVGADGKTYGSAGESVRNQILTDLDILSKTLPSYMYNIPQTSGFLNSSGAFVENNGVKSHITDYIPVKEGEKYRVVSKANRGFDGKPWIAFYDKTLKYISGVENNNFVNNEYIVTIPSGVCYMRCQSAIFSENEVANSFINIEIYPYDENDGRLNLLDVHFVNFDKLREHILSSDQSNVRISYMIGYYTDGRGVLQSNDGIMSKTSDYIPVKPGDKIVGKSRANENMPYLLYYDNHMRFVEGFSDDAGIVDINKTIPDGVTFIRLQSSLYDSSSINYINGNMPLEFSISFDGVRVRDTTVDNDIKQKIHDETSDIKNGILRVGERKNILTASNLIHDGALIIDGEISNTLKTGYHSDYIDISLFGDGFYLKTSFGLNSVGACVYDSNKKFIKIVDGTKDDTVSVKDLFIPATSFKGTGQEAYIRVGYFSYGTLVEEDFQCYTKEPENVAKLLEDMQESIDSSGNVLLGKKYVACGDSFTEGRGLGDEYYDDKLKMWKTYPWWIAKRNHMTLINEAKSGSDFTNIEGSSNAFSVDRYKQIPKDADYITLMFGLNETTLTDDQIGTKADDTNTTLWGAYNVVLEYFLTNMPYAKIGIIISDAWMPTKYANTLKDICKYWGIPYLDLKGDNQVPMGIGGRFDNSDVNPKAISLRNSAFQVSLENSHPNGKAHEYRSTIVENFLRSL